MHATFVELPAFQRVRELYFDDESFKQLQNEMMRLPEAGDIIRGTGGLRKLRFGDERRGKGKRGGLRVIYFWKDPNDQFWLFTVYDKDEASNLSAKQRDALRERLQMEIAAENQTMTKRDIFSELLEGFDALEQARLGKTTLKTTSAEYKPPSPSHQKRYGKSVPN
ncbi:hypothetical protein AB2N08_12655 [Massilia aurea]|uniref:hypothetical protein n=1 Tax=Massilia aurea TaxID=373040 RepID=UPI003461ECE7